MTSPPRGGHYNRKCTPSPTSDGFKTPQNPKANPKTLATRCASEPVKAKKKLANTPRYGKYFFFTKKLLLNQLFVCIFIEPALIHLRGPSAWSLQCPLLYHVHLQLGRPATTVSNNPRKDFTLSHKL